MATPSRSNAVSTPKNNMAGTPTRVMASPRPGLAGAGGRPFAGKSPAVKTPASGQGHSHNLSSSSHPSSTPLPAPVLADDLLALNSPAAALMASLSGHGLTPLPTGQDGLGVSTLRGGVGSDLATARNVEGERLSRLQEVADTLRSKLAGPGITREGVERLAKMNGFALLIDGDKLNIAGNFCVDLEIAFDHTSLDSVKNVVLKIDTSDEDEHKKVASGILKNDLTQSSQEGRQAPWKSLDSFATNLSYLSQLDHLSSKVNCFAAIAGLHSSFQAIWEEEKKRHTWRNGLHHLSRGSAGRPSMDHDGKLGLSIDYWGTKQQLQEDSNASRTWSAKISCEAGAPSITKFRSWIALEVFDTPNVEGESQEMENSIPRLAWREPAVDGLTGTKEDQDAMMESLETILEPSNVRFVSHLNPPVLLPLSTILGLNTHATFVEVDQTKVVTYLDELKKLKRTHGDARDSQLQQIQRQVTVIDQANQIKQSSHQYSLFAVAPIWCYPVDRVVFSHPRQLVEALPTLRQYALFWTLLEKVVSAGSMAAPASQLEDSKSVIKDITSRKRSNRPKKDKLQSRQDGWSAAASKLQSSQSKEVLSVSISLDLITDPAVPTIHMFLPFVKQAGMGKVSVGVQLNGNLVVSSTFSELSEGKIADKMARVIALSEDLGVVLERILEEVREFPK